METGLCLLNGFQQQENLSLLSIPEVQQDERAHFGGLTFIPDNLDSFKILNNGNDKTPLDGTKMFIFYEKNDIK